MVAMLSAFCLGQANREDQKEMSGDRQSEFKLFIPTLCSFPVSMALTFKQRWPVVSLLDTAHTLPGFPKSFFLGGSFLKDGGSGAEDILTNNDLLPKNKIRDFFSFVIFFDNAL